MPRDMTMKDSLRTTLLELVTGVLLGGCMLLLGSWVGAKLGSGASNGWGDIWPDIAGDDKNGFPHTRE